MRLPNFSRKRTSHEKRTGDEGMMTSVMSKAVVVATSLMIHGTSAQSGTTNTSAVPSCVQVVTANFSSCPCDASVYAFSMVGDTSVATNTVNLAVVLDASSSIKNESGIDEWALEVEFAKDVVAAFAERNLFENGGTASYVQFSNSAMNPATLTSKVDFDTYVDETPRGLSSGTDIADGIAAGRELLNASPSSAAFMVVVTDGDVTNGPDPFDEAEAARNESTTVFAVGVGDAVSTATLLAIAGDASNVFAVDGFEEFDGALGDILTASGGSTVPCPATGASVTVEFAAPVTSVVDYPGASTSGTNTVTFLIDDLEESPTDFAVVLNTCSVPAITESVVNTVSYTDDQSNLPDMSKMLGTGPVLNCPDAPSPAPTVTANTFTVPSCVQVSPANFSACPCDASAFAFTMVGETSVAANTVNLAVVLDASGSINNDTGIDEWGLEKEFAKNTIAAFASRNLFENGGTASYVQFSDDANFPATFTSEAGFDAYIDATIQVEGDTNIVAGIAAGRELLNTSPSSAAFMIVVTDGDVTGGYDDPSAEAQAARDDGITVFVVGVGDDVSLATLLAISGDVSNKFEIDGFGEFDDALGDILTASGGSVVPCLATGIIVTVDFAATVTSVVDYAGVSISGTNTVTFLIDDLESNPTQLSCALNTCSMPTATGSVVNSISYTDNQSNSPDFSEILACPMCSSCP